MLAGISQAKLVNIMQASDTAAAEKDATALKKYNASKELRRSRRQAAAAFVTATPRYPERDF